MAKDLLIPYAIHVRSGVSVNPDELAKLMENISSTFRLQSTQQRATATRNPEHYACPACGGLVYPHAPFSAGGRYFWAHRRSTADDCPLVSRATLTPERINAIIFQGRQEGDAHRQLVETLSALARVDSNISAESISFGKYEPPSEDMIPDFPHGRFPDVSFDYLGYKIVLEAQLATISLHGINGRRAFYDRLGHCLIWITRSFDPKSIIRASVRDIIADQQGKIFSLDKDVIDKSNNERAFYVRQWSYDADKKNWNSIITPIIEVAKNSSPNVWAHSFKSRFAVAFDGKKFGFNGTDSDKKVDLFLDELYEKAGITIRIRGGDVHNLVKIVSLLISLEAGRVYGTRHANLVAMINNFPTGRGYLYDRFVRTALKKWHPELITRHRSIQDTLQRAKESYSEGEVPYGRRSVIGKIRATLFPQWILD